MEYRAGTEINDSWESVLAEPGREALSDLLADINRSQNWKAVTLPHNWEDYHGCHRVSHGNLHGTAWYRKRMLFSPEWKKKRVWLLFEGVGSYADVWVNGTYVGGHQGGRTCFSLDITDALTEGEENILLVRARHPAKIRDLPWVCGGCFGTPNTEGSQPLGIFRPVHIQLTGDVRVVPFGVYIAPQRSADHSWDTDHLWDVRIETELFNAGSTGKSGTLRQELLDASGAVLAKVEAPYTIGSRAKAKILQMIPSVRNIRLWSPESPSLYHIRTSVEEDTERCLSAYQTHSGRICTGVEEDSVENSFGFREIAWENFDGCDQQSIDQQKLREEPSEKNQNFVRYSIGGKDAPVAIVPGGVEIRVDAENEENVRITWNTTVRNNSAVPHTIQLESFVQTYNRTKSIASRKDQREIASGQSVTCTQTCGPLQYPDVWSKENPVLHNIVSTVRGVDEELRIYCQTETSFGIRPCAELANKGNAWIEEEKADPVKRRFLMNGKHVFINGTCEYEHELGRDHAFTEEMIRARMQMIQAAGFNALREAHCPHNLRYLEYCEKHGILYWAQMGAHLYFDTEEFRENFRTLTQEWIRERRNSPAVILWGVQNESMLPAEFTREITGMIHRMDATAPAQRKVVTCNGGTGSDWNIPQNWTGTYGGSVETYGADARRMKLIGEYGQYRVKGKHQEGNMEEQQNSGGDVCEELFSYCLETKVREAEKNREYFYGHFQWIFSTHANPGRELLYCLDGLGTNNVGVVNNKGLFTCWGEPTDAYYMYRSNYVSPAAEPMVYISSHSWPDRLTSPGKADISVYSNCDEVELYDGPYFLGRMARGKKGEHTTFRNARISEGTLTAKGYYGGKCMAEDHFTFPALSAIPVEDETTEIVRASEGDLYRVNCGGKDYRDSNGFLWSADQKYSRGNWGWRSWGMAYTNVEDEIGSFGRSCDRIRNTREQGLLQTFRYGKGRLAYEFPADDGEYRMELYFSEPWYGCAGENAEGWRLFDVDVNGETVLSRMDIWSEAGGADRAVRKQLTISAVNGKIVLDFPMTYSNQAVIQAVRIYKL